MLLALFFVLACANLCTSQYNIDLVSNALNISQAAYCLGNMDTWSCATCTDTNTYETKVEIKGELVIFGYNQYIDSIFIGFRGSSNIQNWLSNIQIIFEHPYEDSNIAVDKGFYDLYHSLKPSIETILSNMSMKYNTHRLLITGHSLGGALATVTAFDMIYHSLPYDINYLITFGSPRVGNYDFSAYFNLFQVYTKRITHYYDIVPHVPEEFLGYMHISNEIWYNEDNSHYAICNDQYEEDSSCSDSCAPTKCTSTSDHMYYLNVSMGNDGFC
jgi:predicted lipase|uniref:Fungal lipase-type domain-containing protein n=1 Tax=viral metagenome TaxID=1070528 RepID=A0A6C0INY6_9ZZZZ